MTWLAGKDGGSIGQDGSTKETMSRNYWWVPGAFRQMFEGIESTCHYIQGSLQLEPGETLPSLDGRWSPSIKASRLPDSDHGLFPDLSTRFPTNCVCVWREAIHISCIIMYEICIWLNYNINYICIDPTNVSHSSILGWSVLEEANDPWPIPVEWSTESLSEGSKTCFVNMLEDQERWHES